MKKHKSKIIIISVIILLIVATVSYVRYLLNQPLDIKLPKEFDYQNQTIPLAWTDDNTGETLIIQTDKKTYTGFNQAQVYFSITNISRQDQDMDIVFWFEDEGRKVTQIERLNTDKPMNSAPDVILNLIQDPEIYRINVSNAQNWIPDQVRDDKCVNIKFL